MFTNGHLGQMDILEMSTPSVLRPFSPFFSNEQWIKYAFGAIPRHLPYCQFCPSVHLGKMGTIKAFRVPLSPTSPLSPKLEVPVFPSAHFQKFWVNGHRELGVPPFFKCPFAPLSIGKFGGNRHRALVVLC